MRPEAAARGATSFLFFILFVSLLGQLELSELVTTSGHRWVDFLTVIVS